MRQRDVHSLGSWITAPRGLASGRFGSRRLLLRADLADAAVSGPGRAGACQPESVVVMVDHAKVVRLPAKAQTVIIGNPAIARCRRSEERVMIVTGKSYGVTNLIALDASGTLLAESLVARGRGFQLPVDRAARA